MGKARLASTRQHPLGIRPKKCETVKKFITYQFLHFGTSSQIFPPKFLVSRYFFPVSLYLTTLNITSMATPSFDEDTAEEVLRQVEYYFSDSNLSRDKFLSKTITSSEDGLVSLALICSSKKLKAHLKLGKVKQEDIADDTLKAVAQTLRNSASLKLSGDGRKVGRVTPLLNPEEIAEKLDQRTVAVSPLPFDIDRESLQFFFQSTWQVNSVRLPKHIANTNAFCGTALVEFSSDEEVQKILSQSFTIGSLQLELKPKKEFDAERAQKSKDFEAANSQLDAKHKENSSTNAYYIKGLIVGFQLKSISRRDQAEHMDKQESGKDDGMDTKEADKPLTSMDKTTEDSQGKVPEDTNNKEEIVAIETEKVNKEKDIENKEEISFDEEELSKDSAGKVARKVHQYDLAARKDDTNVMTREDLKAVFSKFGKVKFIDFHIGEDSGYVRFHRPDGAEKACAAAVLAKEEGLVVKNFIATLEPLTGDAEKEYWMRLRENKDKHSQKRGTKLMW
ncbi:La protein 1 [Linum perenne]